MSRSPSQAAHYLITGCSSGIGAAVLQQALDRGVRVSACARRGEALAAQVASRDPAQFQVDCVDVADADAMRRFAERAVARFGPFDAVIANAGHGCDGEISELDEDAFARVFATNVAGVHHTVRATRPHWAPGATLLAVSSVVSAVPVPRMGAYCATKHALEGYLAALRMETRAQGHRVLSCCPGPVATEFFERALPAGRAWTWRPGQALTAQRVAGRILRQIARGGPTRVYLPWSAALAVHAYRLAPGLAEWWMARQLRRM